MSLETFYVTFGQKSLARDGYVEIQAQSYDDALLIAKQAYGDEFSMLYKEQQFDPHFYPKGRISKVKIDYENR